MLSRRCKSCNSKFSVKSWYVKAGWGKYCSQKCKNEGQRNGKVVTCFICGKSVYRAKRRLQKSKSKKYFCGKSCQTVWRNSTQYVGPKHLNWKGGISSDTYRALLKRTSKKEVCSFCKVTDKRVLAAHHKGFNHQNNKVGNLMWLCHNCHFLLHHYPKDRT
jgi:hypothetical protein